MKLNKEVIFSKNFPTNFNAPHADAFNLPEKILQFGTGVLLRALPDFYIDKANKQNVFNGRVVVVKSTGSDVHEFTAQDNLYTHCIKGITDGAVVEEFIINASISKVLSAKTNWNNVLKYAESEDMQIIISNTTEVGIVLKSDDDINSSPPESFPAKLLAFLYHRFTHFKGNEESGMVIIPTELIVDNGKKLKEIILQLAEINNLNNEFKNWINTANDFCSSLVDRIVPGSLKNKDQIAFEQKAGYKDALTIMSEPYSLWAIESSSERTKNILSFSNIDKTIVVTADINKYRELKLRLLNATHTFSCALAYLSGFNLVYEAMHDDVFSAFVKDLMLQEILPCITGNSISKEEAQVFANNVIDRFCNPFIEHKWLSISLNYSAKIKMRCVPLLLRYYAEAGNVAPHMAVGFAAYILFTKPVELIDGVYYGIKDNSKYKIDDTNASFFYTLWKNISSDEIAEKVLSNESLWETDLTKISGFSAMVQNFLKQFHDGEFKTAIQQISKQLNLLII